MRTKLNDEEGRELLYKDEVDQYIFIKVILYLTSILLIIASIIIIIH
jgi:hypothetical protein